MNACSIAEDSDSGHDLMQRKKIEYIQTFSIHGLSRIYNGTKMESMFWSCVLLLGVSFSSFFIYELISKFFRYEVYTSVTYHVTDKNAFPSITFCDFELMKHNYFSYCGVTDSSNISTTNKPCDLKIEDPPVVTNILNTSEQWSNGVFHVQKCVTWGGTTCTNDRYLKSVRSLNNTCFTWNWQGNLYDTYSHAAIEFELNKTSGLHFSFLFGSVQDPDVNEIDLTNTVFFESSKSYQLLIKKSVIKRLPFPFPSNCSKDKPHQIFPGKYTRTTCIESLNFIDMLKHCGAVPDYVRLYIPRETYEHYKRNITITEARACMDLYARRKVIPTVECPVPCEEMELHTTSTFHQIYHLHPSVYSINIQYQEVDSYKIIEEKQLFTWDQIAGQVGGFLGLVVGVSLISIIEIIAYLTLCFLQKIRQKSV